MTEYALESKGLPMWHAVKERSWIVVRGLCGHLFSVSANGHFKSQRPDEDSLCAGCKHAEQQQTKATSDTQENMPPGRATFPQDERKEQDGSQIASDQPKSILEPKPQEKETAS